MTDYVDAVLAEAEDVSGIYGDEGEGYGDEETIWGLVEVGALEEVGAQRVLATQGRQQRAAALARVLGKRPVGAPMPSPPFARSARDTTRRAPLGFVEDGSGAFFFSLAAVVGATTTMRAKVSRTAHTDRLLIVPSAPGVVMQSVQVGDEEQLLSAGAPVELYSVAALTDSVPDNFSPLGPALDFVVTLFNTTAGAITGTIGIKAAVDR
jgi:hypothetical protein